MIGGNAAHVLICSSDKKKILLTQRRDIPMWVMPGGHVQKGESYKSAAIREVKEETGLNIKINHLAVRYFDSQRNISKYLYTGSVLSGKIKTSKETKKVQWFDFQNLPMLMTLYERNRIQLAHSFNGKLIKKTLYFNKKEELKFQLKNPIRFFVFLIYSLKKRA